MYCFSKDHLGCTDLKNIYILKIFPILVEGGVIKSKKLPKFKLVYTIHWDGRGGGGEKIMDFLHFCDIFWMVPLW